jgi:precorrin-4/cobalt-precorrin-4 C11-methyltransferase
MTVHFIGAGPGAPDLITVRGRRHIRRAPVVLYAGSLVPKELVAEARPDARVIDTAPMTLDAIIAEMKKAHAKGHDVARVHSGDPSLYGAIAEQMRRLDALGIPYDVTPGVPAFAAAAAALGRELTLPEISQTVILTRTAVRASSMPKGEELAALGRSGSTLAIHLSINNLARVVRDLVPLYGADCPVAIAHRVTWPDQAIVQGTLADIRAKAKAAGFTRTALILVGRVLGDAAFVDSRLYAPDHSHVLREATPGAGGSRKPRATPDSPRRSGSATRSKRRTAKPARG